MSDRRHDRLATVLIVVRPSRNTRSLSNVDPKRRQIRNRAYVDLTRTHLERGRSREFKWVETLYPLRAQAEDSVNGRLRFTCPAVYAGAMVEGIELHFEEGRVVKAAAARNEELLLEAMETDTGARRLGEWAIGSNERIKRFTKSTLIDEKIGGTLHMANGSGYPETDSENKSAIHWDPITGMSEGGQVVVDGKLFYDSGEFKV